MVKRINRLLKLKKVKDGVMINTFNKSTSDISFSITTRIDAGSHWVVVDYEKES